MTLWNKFQMVFGEIINDIQEYKQILDYSIVFNKNLLFYSYIGFPFDLFIDEIIKRKFNITQIYRKELLWNKTIIYNEFISQLNKFYNYELSNDIISNITNLTKIDNNLNMYDHNYQRIVNNSFYYTDTLTILDNLKINKSISNSDVLTMKSFLANSVIYTNYTINCDSNTLVLTDKSPYYLINRGYINYISNGTNNLYIPIINNIILLILFG
jgi:hypothetical protein